MILIKDSVVVDGTGKPGQKADVLIKDSKIEAIGQFSNQHAETVIDGRDMITCPGFIDVNTDSDHYLSLFTDKSQHDFLLQGVTTIFGGHCGSSLAPLLRGSLVSIRKWGDVGRVNVDWQLVGEFLDTLGRLNLGVNFGTLVGHSTIRRALIGEDVRDLTEKELQAMAQIVKQALKQGAFGLSTGLGYNHSHSTPYQELKFLTDLVVEYDGVYTTHIRDEREHLVLAVQEAINIARESKIPTIISHFRAIHGFENQFASALAEIEKAAKDGVEIYFDSYPFDYSILPIYMLLPDSLRRGNLEYMLGEVQQSFASDELKRTLPTLKLADLIVARAPGFDYLVGKSLAHYAEAEALKPPEALMKFMRVTKLRAVLFYKNINLEATTAALLSSRALLASNSPSLVEDRNIIENERAAKSFSRFLDLALKRGQSMEQVVEKLTMLPARIFGLRNRGVLREGMMADVVVLSGSHARHVLVGGKLAVKDGQFQSVYNGEILRRG